MRAKYIAKTARRSPIRGKHKTVYREIGNYPTRRAQLRSRLKIAGISIGILAAGFLLIWWLKR